MTRVRVVLEGSRWRWVEIDESGENVASSALFVDEQGARIDAVNRYGEDAIIGALEVWPPLG